MPIEKETVVQADGHGDGKTEKVDRGGGRSNGIRQFCRNSSGYPIESLVNVD